MPVNFRGQMATRSAALKHPAAPLLKKYATQGCEVSCGQTFTKTGMAEVVHRGPHTSVRPLYSIAALKKERKEKSASNQCRFILWEEVTDNTPPQLNIYLVEAISHNIRKFRAIINLSFKLMINGLEMPSLNEAMKCKAKQEAIEQLEKVLLRIIAEIEEEPEDNGPFFSEEYTLNMDSG